MGVASQTDVSTQVRQFTEEEMKRYFAPFPTKLLWTAIVGVLILFIGVSASSGTMIFIGLVVLLIGGGLLAMRLSGSKPTDEEYDAWVESQARMLVPRAIQKLGLIPEQLIRAELRFDSHIVPGSRGAGRYPVQEVKSKKGKDGRWRFSVNKFIYFLPTEHHLGAYTGDVNALNQASHVEQTEEYFYQDITGATTNEVQDSIRVGAQVIPYQAQLFSLKTTGGNSIDTPLGLMPVSGRTGPSFAPPNDFDATLNSLRALLRSKKQGGGGSGRV